MSQNDVRVGVGVYICYEGKILVFKRIKEHGRGQWSAIGGHLEHGEHWFDTALREAREEAGIEVHSPRLFAVTNDVFPESGKHYITLQVEVRADSADFINAEPEKHVEMGWYRWEDVPTPRFPGIQSVYDQNLKPGYLNG